MKAFKNILVSLLMLSLTGYAAWFTYNQILALLMSRYETESNTV